MPWNYNMLRRCKRMFDLMDTRGIDFAVVSDPKNVYYFTGYYNRSVLPKPTHLCFMKPGGVALLVGTSEKEAAERTFGGELVLFPDYDLNMHMLAYPDKAETYLRAFLLAKKVSPKRAGIETWSTPYSAANSTVLLSKTAEVVDVSHSILAMRQVKDGDEVQLIRRSCVLTDLAYAAAKKAAVSGKTEVEVYGEVYEEVVKEAKQYVFFSGDFVSGDRSLKTGGPPTTRILGEGETFILDLWVTTEGYWSDLCRTLVIGGKPTAEQTRMLSLLKEAALAGEEKLKPGTLGREVYKAVQDVIAKAGYGDKFPHHAGHGIGLDAWEPPFLIPGSDEALKEGMVCALEPGVYVPEVGGIRIENNYAIGPNGPQQLNQFPVDF